jgi:hypothetical protein
MMIDGATVLAFEYATSVDAHGCLKEDGTKASFSRDCFECDVLPKRFQTTPPVIGSTTGRSLLSFAPAGCTVGVATDSSSAGSGFSGIL